MLANRLVRRRLEYCSGAQAQQRLTTDDEGHRMLLRQFHTARIGAASRYGDDFNPGKVSPSKVFQSEPCNGAGAQ